MPLLVLLRNHRSQKENAVVAYEELKVAHLREQKESDLKRADVEREKAATHRKVKQLTDSVRDISCVVG